MTVTQEFFAFLTCTAMLAVYHCNADRLPPPTGLTYSWADNFTVNISWQKPSGVQEGEVKYRYHLMSNETEIVGNMIKLGLLGICGCVWRNFTDRFLTEDIKSDQWTYHISSVTGVDKSQNESTPESILIETPKRRLEVKDIRCLLSFSLKEINCSWITGNKPIKLSYRVCGHTEKLIKPLTECNDTYSNGPREGCCLKPKDVTKNICILMETEDGMRSFIPALEIPSPELSVKEEGGNLQLSWTPPENGIPSCWEYTVYYKQCKESKGFRKFIQNGKEKMTVAYDKRCRYEFRSHVNNTDHCPEIFSRLGDVVTYGTDELPDDTVTVVAIVIPVLLSVCIILSCYCFRRHSSILCPIIPDPSAIFKEMMMNGNKELKNTTGSLYTPVPEPIEPCKITLVTENSGLQENS